MWILPLIGYLGLVLGFFFLTLAIASGLYYLSELVEEHTVSAKKLLSRLIYAIIAFQVLLCLIDRLPIWLSLLCIGSHAIYYQNLRHFPIVRLSDPIFIASCLLVLLNHYLWFLHFSNPSSPQFRTQSYRDYTNKYTSATSPPSLPSFTEIASFFFLQVWLVPFSLFVSLSAGDNILPSMGSEYATDPTSPLVSSPGVGGGSSSLGLQSMAGMLSPRSPSAGGGGGSGQRSPSAVRDGALGHDSGRRAGRRGTGAKGLVRVAVDGARGWIGETGEAMGLWRGERTRPW